MTNEPIPRVLFPHELPRELLAPGDHVRFNGRMVEVDTVTRQGARTALTVRSLATGRPIQGPRPSNRPVKGTALRSDAPRPEVLTGKLWATYEGSDQRHFPLAVPLTHGAQALLAPDFYQDAATPLEESLYVLRVEFPASARFGALTHARYVRDDSVTTDDWSEIAHRMRMIDTFTGGLSPAGHAILAFAEGRTNSSWSQVAQMWLAALTAHAGVTLTPEAGTFVLRLAPTSDCSAIDLIATVLSAFAPATN